LNRTLNNFLGIEPIPCLHGFDLKNAQYSIYEYYVILLNYLKSVLFFKTLILFLKTLMN
jgi:hypothetical protein